jgi:outer membrane immunogenic protein
MRSNLISSLAGAAFSFAASGFAFAADMDVSAPPPPPATGYSWTGWYVGGNIGYSFGSAKSDFNIPPSGAPAPTGQPGGSPITIPGVAFTDAQPQGVIGGGQIGYNWQASPNWVFGLETDLQASGERTNFSQANAFDVTSSFPCPGGATCITVASGAITTAYQAKIAWFGTVRGRVGYAWSNLLLYGTGGLAYGRVSVSGTQTASGIEKCSVLGECPLPPPSTPVPFSSTTTFAGSRVNVGWTVGGGIEGVLWNNWTWKLEYLYMDLGTLGISAVTSTGALGTGNTKFTDNIFRVGLNYQFH